MLDQALQHTRGGLTEARRALKALRASPLDDLELALALRTLAESVAARASLILEVELPNQVERVAPEIEQCVYRIAQEALTNVARHAEAKLLRLSLEHDSKQLMLTIVDDGRGFDPTAVNGARFGLTGLRERAEMIGGRLEVESALQRGTIVQLVLPMSEVKQ
jgi:signal transduction histidine kinase